jgi:hypothetical protein
VWVDHKIEKKKLKQAKPKRKNPGQDAIYCNIKMISGAILSSLG